ncbi:MAG: DUF2304 domain-containing protein [Bryobacteraceae bacterium]|nr:DUF2304 domain-containing protein [Bryobacteraceae bacterium]
MTKIQLLLIVCLVLGAAWFAWSARLSYRIALFTLMLLGVYFVALPDHTTAVAHFLGVGRGTDLLLYLSLVTGGYTILLLYRRTRQLERKLTEHIRAMAIERAETLR